MARKSLSLSDLAEPAAEPATALNEPAPTELPRRGNYVHIPKAVLKTALNKPPYRKDKRAFTAWASIEAYRQLKLMAVQKDTTVQELLEEGMDLVFKKYGYDQIAKK